MAAEVNKPDFSYQWASGGAIVAPSTVKMQTGWTAEVPPFQWENYLQNRQDNAILHLFQKGISEWDAASNYYFTTSGVRSYVQGSDGIIYVAVADSVGQNPTTDGSDTYWKVAFADNSTSVTIASGDARYAQRSNNLSDLSNVTTARTNLQVYSKTESDGRRMKRIARVASSAVQTLPGVTLGPDPVLPLNVNFTADGGMYMIVASIKTLIDGSGSNVDQIFQTRLRNGTTVLDIGAFNNDGSFASQRFSLGWSGVLTGAVTLNIVLQRSIGSGTLILNADQHAGTNTTGQESWVDVYRMEV